MTGYTWNYPEFKGVFDQVDWMRLDLASGSALLLDTEPGSRVGVLRPANRELQPGETERDFSPMKAVWDYPERGGLFLFHKVPAVGTKFREAIELGPQSQPEIISGPIAGQVIFRVR